MQITLKKKPQQPSFTIPPLSNRSKTCNLANLKRIHCELPLLLLEAQILKKNWQLLIRPKPNN